jgi:hypothetical protein
MKDWIKNIRSISRYKEQTIDRFDELSNLMLCELDFLFEDVSDDGTGAYTLTQQGKKVRDFIKKLEQDYKKEATFCKKHSKTEQSFHDVALLSQLLYLSKNQPDAYRFGILDSIDALAKQKINYDLYKNE